ncbi:ATP-grasp domain-containing protein [Streptomyces sp. FH025]|uniref:D-alanine--D-alanine ligase family protein n=1 Tax=Streptomyces sp. FH025 TaxID=2815937 RepID=UPI001A9DF63F|nr:ATP-grasp domain-containing protein [Streptomyces sp. FH025]MBO1418644.1 ATP-grasp domain-containing protein [Streptomyces sp. FH025]
MTVFLNPETDKADEATVKAAAAGLRDWQQSRQDLNVALVYGPVSEEDRLYIDKSPVDQLSVTALSRTLGEIGLRFEVLNPVDRTFVPRLTAFDVALSNLHGPFGEDGRLQGLLDYLRIPYCGSGVAASAVAADKILCKRVMGSLGVPTPAWQEWTGGTVEWDGHTVMVKPPLGGSSVGMSLVKDRVDLLGALVDASGPQGHPVLVEEYITGQSVTVGLLELPGNAVLIFPPLATEVHQADFYDAATKLDEDATGGVTVAAADLPAEARAAVLEYAKRIWTGLGLKGSARVDFIVTEDSRVFALEVNSTPGMSAGSNFAVGAELCGLSHGDVVLALLHEALVRPPYDVPLPTPHFTGFPGQREFVA